MTDKSKGLPSITRRATLAGLAAGGATLAMPGILRAQGETIRIGFPTPLTGPFAAEAKDQVKSAELAVKLINDKGGIAGRKVELLVRDDKLNAGEAATRTLELIEKDKVHAIVGALSSAVQLAVNEVTRARGVIYVSISQSDTINEIKDFSRFTFHEALNPHMTTAAVAKHTFKKDAKIAYLVADYAYGHEMLRGFKRAQQAIGATSVGEILHPFGAADYSTFMPRLRSMRPDILCICNFGRDQANSIKQAVDFGMNRQSKIVVPVLLHNQRLAIGPEAFEGVIGGANYYWGLEDTIPAAKSFNDAFKAANGGAYPTDYGAYGFTGSIRCCSPWRRRRDRHRQGDRGARAAEIRHRQGPAALPRVRPPVGAVGPGARVQEEGRDEERRRPLQGARHGACLGSHSAQLFGTGLPGLSIADTRVMEGP